MNISELKITEILDMLLTKIKDVLHLTDFTQIDLKNLTSAILISFTITSIIFFVLWLLRAIGLYKMSKKKGDSYAFLAFIPYFCLYIQGKIVGKTRLFGIEIEHTELVLPLMIISTMLPFGKPIALLLFFISYFAILYRLYSLKVPNFAILLLILSILLPFLQPFILFTIRNKEDAV
ncbi:MAG: hypothetical protein PHP54_00770 [Clostridia bacterium]|nr:hypothetical protein [Clostridia bacterium]